MAIMEEVIMVEDITMGTVSLCLAREVHSRHGDR